MALSLVSSVAARADDLTVDCDAAKVGQVRNAIFSLSSLEGPHSITINGTCREPGPVPIDQRERLTLLAGPAGGAIVTANHQFAAVRISQSSNITLAGLDISGGGNGINVYDSTQVDLESCNIHDNLRSGVVVFHGSRLDFNGGSVNHNGRNGFGVGEGHLTIDSTDISGNAWSGISASDTSAVTASNLTLRDNGTYGVIVFHVSELVLTASTVTGNGNAGIRVSETSHGEIYGGNVIRNNGRANGDPGVYVSEQGEVFLGGADISGNAGDGVRGTAGATLSGEGGNTITGNGRDGIRLDRGSFEQFLATDTFSGNARANIRCDSVSWIAGDPGTDKRVQCRRVEALDDDGQDSRDRDSRRKMHGSREDAKGD